MITGPGIFPKGNGVPVWVPDKVDPPSDSTSADPDEQFPCSQDSPMCKANGAPCRRSLAELRPRELAVAHPLDESSKRSVDAPGNDMDQFMHSVFTSPAFNYTVPVDRAATSAVEQFQDNDVKIGLGAMYGCTSLVVISRRGVYMTHYYESPYFYDDQTQEHTTPEQYQSFADNILSSITTGSTDNGTQHVDPLDGMASDQSRVASNPADANLLFTPDDNVQAFIISPHRWYKPNDARFPDRLNQIKATASSLLPPQTTFNTFLYQRMSQTPEVQAWVRENPSGSTVDWESEITQQILNTANSKVLVDYSKGQGYKVWMMRNTEPVVQDQWNV